MRHRFALVWVALGACALFQVGCTLVPPAAPSLLFGQTEGGCRAGGQTDEAHVLVDHGQVVVSGVILTDTPCQHLVPSLRVGGDWIVLSADSIAQPGACPICLGSVAYQARIVGLEPGRYTLRVKHRDRTVAYVDMVIAAGL
ncbi:MAG: hypothetical protein ACP5G2_01150 [Candidatus Bipolaricaulaceae bacterium]